MKRKASTIPPLTCEGCIGRDKMTASIAAENDRLRLENERLRRELERLTAGKVVSIDRGRAAGVITAKS